MLVDNGQSIPVYHASTGAVGLCDHWRSSPTSSIQWICDAEVKLVIKIRKGTFSYDYGLSKNNRNSSFFSGLSEYCLFCFKDRGH